jgi:hypothetical protein
VFSALSWTATPPPETQELLAKGKKEQIISGVFPGIVNIPAEIYGLGIISIGIAVQ